MSAGSVYAVPRFYATLSQGAAGKSKHIYEERRRRRILKFSGKIIAKSQNVYKI
jgi:hypothetical protein